MDASEVLSAKDAKPSGRADQAIPHPRSATRVAVEFFLRQAEILSGIVDGDFVLGLVIAAMGSSNVRRISRSRELNARYAAIDQAPPDEAKTPISVLALAASLGLPYETARRYVGRLERMGLCVRCDGGWIVPAEQLASHGALAVIERSAADIRQFIIALRAAGVDVDAIR